MSDRLSLLVSHWLLNTG